MRRKCGARGLLLACFTLAHVSLFNCHVPLASSLFYPHFCSMREKMEAAGLPESVLASVKAIIKER